jgi:uncharacterized protein YndB with AHSA1/START domain
VRSWNLDKNVKVIETSGGQMKRSVEAFVHIQAAPQHVLDAFLRAELLQGWWGVERALVEPKEGGVYALGWNISKAGFKYVFSGVIGSYHPNRCLHITNAVYFNPERQLLGPMNLHMDVAEDRGGSHLHLVQDGYQSGQDWDWYYAAVKEAWPIALESLKKFLEKENSTDVVRARGESDA